MKKTGITTLMAALMLVFICGLRPISAYADTGGTQDMQIIVVITEPPTTPGPTQQYPPTVTTPTPTPTSSLTPTPTISPTPTEVPPATPTEIARELSPQDTPALPTNTPVPLPTPTSIPVVIDLVPTVSVAPTPTLAIDVVTETPPEILTPSITPPPHVNLVVYIPDVSTNEKIVVAAMPTPLPVPLSAPEVVVSETNKILERLDTDIESVSETIDIPDEIQKDIEQAETVKAEIKELLENVSNDVWDQDTCDHFDKLLIDLIEILEHLERDIEQFPGLAIITGYPILTTIETPASSPVTTPVPEVSESPEVQKINAGIEQTSPVETSRGDVLPHNLFWIILVILVLYLLYRGYIEKVKGRKEKE